MSIAVYVQRPRTAPPELREDLFTGFGMTWTDYLGRVWDLTTPDGGVVMLAGDVEGLHTPPEERFVSTSPGRAGSRHRGVHVLERPVFWPLAVYSDASSAAWVAHDAAFFDSFRRPGTWTVISPSGSRRTLVCRRVSRGDHAFGWDPSAEGWATYEVELVAEDPYWRGAPVKRPLAIGEDSQPFIPETGAPDFYISQGATVTGATIANPGDVDAWPVYTIEAEGPVQATVGLDGAQIGIVPELADGDVAVVDTARQALTINGVRVRGALAPHDFAPIPAGEAVELAIDATGPGTITVQFVPLYERAW